MLKLPSILAAFLVSVRGRLRNCRLKKEARHPMWKNLRQHVDVDDPTPLLNQVYLWCTQRAAENDDQMDQRQQ